MILKIERIVNGFINTWNRQLFFLFILTLFNIKFNFAQSDKFAVLSGGAININNFNWSIAGSLQGQSPNILSELHFNKIISLGFFMEGIYKPIKRLELSTFYQQNEAISGKGTDVDYKEDNRSNPTYEETFLSNKGRLAIFKVGANFWFLHRNRIRLGAGIFYRSTTQNFYILKFDLEDLNSDYQARWKSSDLSVQGNYQINRNLLMGTTFNYSFTRYNAEANWNLIGAFMHPLSFSQHSRGKGFDTGLKLSYKVNNSLSFTMDGTVGKTKTFKGIDKSYLQDNTQVFTQFNGANNDTYGFRIGTKLAF